MNERSKPVAMVAGLLFGVYTLGWFGNWLLRHHHHRQEAVGIAEIVLIGLIVAVAMFRWAARWPLIEAMPRLVVAIAIGCVASALLSPFAGGSYPFKGGAGDFFLKIWIFLGASIVGMLLGSIAVVAVGKDYRTGALRRVEAARLKAARAAAGKASAPAKPKQKPSPARSPNGKPKTGTGRR
jgi:hypothetical protein